MYYKARRSPVGISLQPGSFYVDVSDLLPKSWDMHTGDKFIRDCKSTIGVNVSMITCGPCNVRGAPPTLAKFRSDTWSISSLDNGWIFGSVFMCGYRVGFCDFVWPSPAQGTSHGQYWKFGNIAWCRMKKKHLGKEVMISRGWLNVCWLFYNSSQLISWCLAHFLAWDLDLRWMFVRAHQAPGFILGQTVITNSCGLKQLISWF